MKFAATPFKRRRERRCNHLTASLRDNETELRLQVSRRVLEKGGIGRLVADVRARQQVHFGKVEVQAEGIDIVLRDRDEFRFDLNLARLHIQHLKHLLQVLNLDRIVVAQNEGVVRVQSKNVLCRDTLKKPLRRALTCGRAVLACATGWLKTAGCALSSAEFAEVPGIAARALVAVRAVVHGRSGGSADTVGLHRLVRNLRRAIGRAWTDLRTGIGKGRAYRTCAIRQHGEAAAAAVSAEIGARIHAFNKLAVVGDLELLIGIIQVRGRPVPACAAYAWAACI